MTTIPEELDDWDDFEEEERERLRALLIDLGLNMDLTEDPDAFE